MRDLHNGVRRLELCKKAIKKLETSDKNKKYIKKFLEILNAEQISPRRQAKYFYQFKEILKLKNKDLDKFTRDDIIELVNKIQGNGYKQNTIKDYKIAIKKIFWTLFNNDKKLRDFCDWMYDKRNKILKCTLKANLEEKKGEPLSVKEFNKVVNACSNIRDKLLIAMAYESGCRPSEYLSLKYEDISKNEYGFKIIVAGKTGVRPIFLVKYAVPYLSQFLSSNKNKEGYIFVNNYGKNKGEGLSLRNASKIFKMAMERAVIDKPKNLYFLRSSAVTRDNISGMSRGAMEKKYGWTAGTKVLRNYDRSTAKDYENEIKRLYGIEKNVEPDKVKRCNRCGSMLGCENYCITCGLPTQEQQTLDEIKNFLLNPKVQQLWKSLKA